MHKMIDMLYPNDVAPLAGAWIETMHKMIDMLYPNGRTPRGCVD